MLNKNKNLNLLNFECLSRPFYYLYPLQNIKNKFLTFSRSYLNIYSLFLRLIILFRFELKKKVSSLS